MEQCCEKPAFTFFPWRNGEKAIYEGKETVRLARADHLFRGCTSCGMAWVASAAETGMSVTAGGDWEQQSPWVPIMELKPYPKPVFEAMQHLVPQR